MTPSSASSPARRPVDYRRRWRTTGSGTAGSAGSGAPSADVRSLTATEPTAQGRGPSRPPSIERYRCGRCAGSATPPRTPSGQSSAHRPGHMADPSPACQTPSAGAAWHRRSARSDGAGARGGRSRYGGRKRRPLCGYWAAGAVASDAGVAASVASGAASSASGVAAGGTARPGRPRSAEAASPGLPHRWRRRRVGRLRCSRRRRRAAGGAGRRRSGIAAGAASAAGVAASCAGSVRRLRRGGRLIGVGGDDRDIGRRFIVRRRRVRCGCRDVGRRIGRRCLGLERHRRQRPPAADRLGVIAFGAPSEG